MLHNYSYNYVVEVIGEEEMAGKFKINLNSNRTNKTAALASQGLHTGM